MISHKNLVMFLKNTILIKESVSKSSKILLLKKEKVHYKKNACIIYNYKKLKEFAFYFGC